MQKSNEPKGKVRFYIMNFVRIILVLALIGAYRNGRPLVLLISAFAFLITFLPEILDRKFGVRIPADFEVFIILFIYGTLFFGVSRGFYEKYWWWDIILNLGASIAFGFIGLTILYVLYKDEQLDASPLIIAIFTFCFAVSLGTMLEFFEFFMDTLFSFNLQASAVDTMKDLIVNSIGSFIVSIAGYLYVKEGKVNIISKLLTNFIEKNPLLFRSKKPETQEEKIKKLIKNNESEKLEFKSTLRFNLFTNEFDKKIEHANLKTISAFLNSNGGTLLIGVSDKSEIVGIEKDKFESDDKLILHLTNLIKQHIGKEFFQFIKFETMKAEEKQVVKIECASSDKPVFLKFNQEEEFYIRSGPSSTKLNGSTLVDYINRRFRKD